MKNKKGFTLTEILLVIVIIGIILSIAIPTAILISKSIKERSYDSKMDSIIVAAELYGKNNKDVFGESEVIQISVETLLANGYVDEDEACERTFGCVLDPRDDSIMNDDPITIKIKKLVVQAFVGPMEVTLSLNFNANGATSIGAEAVGCNTLNGSTCIVTAPTITRDGYTILGWSKSSSATTSSYDVSSNIEIGSTDNDSTYYAVTSKNLVATFNKNNASSISATSANCTIYNTQTGCTITSPTITAASGYVAVGWNTNSAATTKQYDQSELIPITSNITYYAVQKTPVTCTKVATSTTTYSCSVGTLSGNQCITTTEADVEEHTYWKCWDRDDNDRVYCTGTHGGSYALLCEDSHGCDTANNYYYCRYACTSDYVCNGTVVSSSTCSTYTAATATTTYSCSTGTLSGSTCYLYNQAYCPAGWTEQ